MTGTHPVPSRPPSAVERLLEFFQPPDPFLLDAGKAGELVIARIRTAVVLMLLMVPLASLALARASEREQHLTGLLITLFALLGSVLVYLTALRDSPRRWLSFTTAIFDVSLVSFALVVYAYIVDPHEAVNSLVTFPTYFLALGGTCLRFDPRVSLVAGVVAMTQYLAIVVFVVLAFPGLTDASTSVAYSPFKWPDQISRLILLGTATALNVYIVRGMQKQRRLSSSDPLTGIFNRRFFDDHLLNETQRAARYNRPFAVAMIDVDHFKRFNDTYGHAVGDQVLKAVARSLERSIRRSDIVARYGGEEFVLLLRETDAHLAVQRVDQLRQRIESDVYQTGAKSLPARLTVSAGVASWPEDGLDPNALTDRADQRLFEAKNGGRNRVVGPASDR